MMENNDFDIDQTLDESAVAADPVDQFNRWFGHARAAQIPLAEAMTLATATKEGRPSARMVLLKQVDDDGFVFFTNYESRKGRELDANPFAALVFYWQKLDYQIRVEGTVSRISSEESDEYFATRLRESQLGAQASAQSEVVANRAALETRFAQLEEEFRDREVSRPLHWGGYLLHPQRIEFWKSRVGRMHDRLLYERQTDGNWSCRRLAP